MLQSTRFENPITHFSLTAPDQPVLYFSRPALCERIDIFRNNFPGTVTYAVKCNPQLEILQAMVAAGLSEFDVASPREIAVMREIAPHAKLNYNNPIRSRKEIAFAIEHEVRSFSIDCDEELNKLAQFAPQGTEVSIRLKLDLSGAAYHFGEKFGETSEGVSDLMLRAQEMGFVVSGTFHVGTQCEIPANYRQYIEEMARITNANGIKLARLNVGGGFPSARNGVTPDFLAYFDEIKAGIQAFNHIPALLCEPGRALIADACQYVVQIKSLRPGRWAFLNDGVYGGLSDVKLMGSTPYHFYAPTGERRVGENLTYHLYGPTCDSIDAFSEDFYLPADICEEDYMLFDGAGAYLVGLDTQFNGYGEFNFVEVNDLNL